jgi:hypothetical protein
MGRYIKKILIILMAMSFNAYGEWSEFPNSKLFAKDIGAGNGTIYIDKRTIKEHKDYVYWWTMVDCGERCEGGNLSFKFYLQGDCGVGAVKQLSYTTYKQSMVKGKGKTTTPENSKWGYPAPGELPASLLDYACSKI